MLDPDMYQKTPADVPPDYKKIKNMLKKNRILPGEMGKFGAGIKILLSRRKYSIETQEIITEMIYRYLKGAK
jgi:hypothetical protein